MKTELKQVERMMTEQFGGVDIAKIENFSLYYYFVEQTQVSRVRAGRERCTCVLPTQRLACTKDSESNINNNPV